MVDHAVLDGPFGHADGVGAIVGAAGDAGDALPFVPILKLQNSIRHLAVGVEAVETLAHAFAGNEVLDGEVGGVACGRDADGELGVIPIRTASSRRPS